MNIVAEKAVRPSIPPGSNTVEFCHHDGTAEPLLAPRIHWLQGNMALENRHDVNNMLRYFNEIFSDESSMDWEKGKMNGKWYDASATSLRGAAYAAVTDGAEVDVRELWFSLPGKLLDQLSLDSQASMLEFLKSNRDVKVTRIDLAVDDYGRKLDIQRVYDHAEAGGVARLTKCHLIRSKDKQWRGLTAYFGSPKADKLVRLYDKFAETQGAIDAIRIEVQYRGEYANMVSGKLLGNRSPEALREFGAKIMGIVGGSIEFREIFQGIRLSRRDVTPWWAAFRERLGGAYRLIMPRILPCIKRKAEWMIRQVSKSISYIGSLVGDALGAYIVQIAQIGQAKMTEKDWRILAQMNRELCAKAADNSYSPGQGERILMASFAAV